MVGFKKTSMATVFGSEGKPHHNEWVPAAGLPNNNKIAPCGMINVFFKLKVRVMLSMPSRRNVGAHEGKHMQP